MIEIQVAGPDLRTTQNEQNASDVFPDAMYDDERRFLMMTSSRVPLSWPGQLHSGKKYQLCSLLHDPLVQGNEWGLTWCRAQDSTMHVRNTLNSPPFGQLGRATGGVDIAWSWAYASDGSGWFAIRWQHAKSRPDAVGRMAGTGNQNDTFFRTTHLNTPYLATAI